MIKKLPSYEKSKWGLILLAIAVMLSIGAVVVYQFLVNPSHMVDKIDSSGREEITWDYAVESAEHGFNGTLYLTEKYGKYNLTPDFDAKNGSSDNLGPAMIQASLSMYKITQNQTYLAYARATADSLKEHMLNDKGIIRNYSKRTGANDSDPTDANFYLLPAIADLAIYDSLYKPLAEKVAYGIVRHGLSEKDIPYGAIYPNGTVADTKTGLPSNGGRQGTVSITVMGLLRAYQATDNPVFLDKGRDILLSLWKNVRTKYDLIPTTFDSVSLRTINDNTQLYATGELLKAYIYCYYLTHDPQIKNIIDDYSSATCDIYWSRATGGYTVESAGHDFNGTLYLTRKYGKYNLTPVFDAKNESSDNLGPALIQASLSRYESTLNQTYLAYARAAADSLKEHMLNDKGIIRNYSKRTGANDSDPTDANFYLLPSIADLAIIDSSYKPLAENVAYGIVRYGLSEKDIPYGAIYPNGTVADTKTGLPSKGGKQGTVFITVIGLMRAYEATDNPVFLNKSKDILLSLWKNVRTKYDLIPTTFDSVSLRTINNSTQLYGTGELLKAYLYYNYLTHDPQIKNIIDDYSSASDGYWGQGYFVYRVNAGTGRQSIPLLETNWHKLDMSLIYAGEVTGQNFTSRVYQDMDTFWLGSGFIYRNHLLRHGTNPDGSPAKNTQSLIDASLRTAVYVMLRMQNQGAFSPSGAIWNEKIYEHVNATRFHHYHPYGYHKDVNVETFQPDQKYYGLAITSSCDEFASLVTLLFKTTPNVRMAWEIFPWGDFTLEPFSTSHSNDVALMKDVFLDYSHREIAFKKIISEGKGRIYCTQNLSEVVLDEKAYHDWKGNSVNIPGGSHECVFVFEGGSYTPPSYP